LRWHRPDMASKSSFRPLLFRGRVLVHRLVNPALAAACLAVLLAFGAAVDADVRRLGGQRRRFSGLQLRDDGANVQQAMQRLQIMLQDLNGLIDRTDEILELVNCPKAREHVVGNREAVVVQLGNSPSWLRMVRNLRTIGFSGLFLFRRLLHAILADALLMVVNLSTMFQFLADRCDGGMADAGLPSNLPVALL